MTQETTELLKNPLNLMVEEREELAGSLIESPEDGEDEFVAAA